MGDGVLAPPLPNSNLSIYHSLRQPPFPPPQKGGEGGGGVGLNEFNNIGGGGLNNMYIYMYILSRTFTLYHTYFMFT